MFFCLRRVASDARARQTINEREVDVLNCVVQQTRSLQGLEGGELTDLVVDISKSAGRAPRCIGATPCTFPHSRLRWRQQQHALDTREMALLEGMASRFAAFESWCQSEKRSRVFRAKTASAPSLSGG